MKKYFLILLMLLIAVPAMARQATFTAYFSYAKDAAKYDQPTGYSMYVNMTKICHNGQATLVEGESTETHNAYMMNCTTDMQYTGDLVFQLAANFENEATSPLSLPAHFFVKPYENVAPTPLSITFEMDGRVSTIEIPTNAQ